jgi:hypothetical protein
MREEKSTPDAVAEEIDYSGRPFDYRDAGTNTSMICEHDQAIKQKIREVMLSLDFNVIEPTTTKEALKYTNFHTFNVIVINENFDAADNGPNNIFTYLNGLSMSIRRQIFVVLISSTFATMDYMNSLNKSVNFIVNKEDLGEMGLILKKEIEENDYFYHVFMETQRKAGKL